jgi:hypothetical protein
MSSGNVFYVGEQPSEPLVITVRDLDGTVIDLSDFVDVQVEGDGLPAGLSEINDAPAGKVQYTLTAPFEESGVISCRVRMTGIGGDVDLSSTFELIVDDATELDTTPLLTPAQAEGISGLAVSISDLARAQTMIGLFVGHNLSDVVWLETLNEADEYWLTVAVAYQAAEVRNRTSAAGASVPYVPGASSIKTGDVAISFGGAAGSADLSELSSLARTALLRLSWLQSRRTVHAVPFLGDGRCEPSRWRYMYTTSM